MAMTTAGAVYWVTGLAGAGKTTIARLLYKYLREKKPNVVLLDGDTLREVYGDSVGHSLEERRKLAMRNARLCRLLAEQGLDVVCATISMFHSCHAWNRENIRNYREIFLNVPSDVLQQRDQKGLYSGAKNGKVIQILGIDITPELPQAPDAVLINDGARSPEDVIKECVRLLGLT